MIKLETKMLDQKIRITIYPDGNWTKNSNCICLNSFEHFKAISVAHPGGLLTLWRVLHFFPTYVRRPWSLRYDLQQRLHFQTMRGRLSLSFKFLTLWLAVSVCQVCVQPERKHCLRDSICSQKCPCLLLPIKHFVQWQGSRRTGRTSPFH